MKKILLLLFLFAISYTQNAVAQEIDSEDFHVHETHDHLPAHFSCGYEGEDILIEKGHSFSTNQEAIQVVNDIMNAVGLRANFKVQAAKVPNAAAIVMGDTRYVLYNPKFIQSIKRGTKTNWSAVSIMAHEIGHHLQGHTLKKTGSRPATELEADEFSGFVLRRMGASLKEAQAAMALLASPYGSATHPAKDKRLEYIAKGWKRADGLYGGENKIEPNVGNEDVADSKEKPKKDKVNKPSKPNKTPPHIKPSKHPTYAQWQVVLQRNPGSLYYITTSNQFVVVKGKKIYPMGQIMKTRNKKYPYVIDMEKTPDLFIADNGHIFRENGEKIGFLSRI